MTKASTSVNVNKKINKTNKETGKMWVFGGFSQSIGGC